jgi:small subunit ribosomal protein S14
MAKKSVRNRNARRTKVVDQFREKRDELREACSNINLSAEERFEAGQALQKLPRNSSRSRVRNRCKLCGRPRAYNRLTGLCRLHMRLATINGMVPGMRKSSW